MPPVAYPYVGNQQVMRAVGELFRRRREEGRSCRVNLHGLLGSGVSCLSTQLHRVNAEAVGDLVWLVGELPDQRATPLGDLLGQLLRQIGVPDADQGATDIARAETCRRILPSRSRPLMVVVDNYRQLEQIQPLLDLDLPNLIIVVTTTDEERELGAQNFRFYEPELLSDTDARELFRELLEETATEIADATIDRLVAHCGGIPLVVRLLAARLVGQAELAEPQLEEIETSTLSLLSLDSERRIHRSLDLAYDSLDLPLQRVYRRLSALPGADFGVPVAEAALRWQGSKSLAMVLAELVKRHLLIKPRAGRYAFHPLVHAHARAQLVAEYADEDNDSLPGADEVRRAVEWYLRESLPRARSMSDRWWVDPVTDLLASYYDGSPPSFTRAEAASWFEPELPNLVAAVGAAYRHGLWLEASALCVTLWNHVHVHQRYDAWIDTHLDGLRAAHAAGDRHLVLQVSSQLGAAYLAIGDTRAARERFQESLEAARELGHALGEQSALEWLGKIKAAERRYQEALAYYAESWAVAEARVSDPERAFATVRLQRARSLLALEQWSAAHADAKAAADFFDTLPNEADNSAKCRQVQGQALLGLGDAGGALPVLTKMLELFETDGSARSIAGGRRVLAAAYRAAGRPEAATEPYRQALAYYERVGDPAADDVRAALNELG